MPESMNGSYEIHDVKKVGETNAELKNEEQTPSHYDHMICEKVDK